MIGHALPHVFVPVTMSPRLILDSHGIGCTGL